MARWAPLRLLGLIGLSFWLAALILPDPALEQISLEEPDITIALPKNLEGWKLVQGEGDLLLRGDSRLDLMELEIERVPVGAKGDLFQSIERRHQQIRQGKEEYAVIFRGEDWRFGNQKLQAYRARYRDRVLGLPIRGLVWQHDVYWPYQGGYLRIGMRYPDIAANYVEPTKYMIAASLRQFHQREVSK